MTAQQDDERRLFEEMQRGLLDFWPSELDRRPNGEYKLLYIEAKFQGWQMARSMAPVVTEAMVEAGARGLSAKQYEHDLAFYGAENIGPPDSPDCIVESEQREYARACLTAALSPHGERVE